MRGLPLSTSSLRLVIDGADWVEALSGRHDRLRVFPAGTSIDAAIRVSQSDVVLIDRGADVSRLLERISSVMPQVPVLAIAPTDALLSALGAGASGVLSSSASEDEVVAAAWALREGLAVFDRAFVGAVFPAEGSVASVVGPEDEPAQPQISPDVEPERSAFTARERQVLDLLVEGLSNREIGERLNISEHTAKFHVNSILQKMGAQKRVEAVVRAARLGLIDL